MSSRLIEVFLPDTETSHVEALLSQHKEVEAWYETLSHQQLWVRIFVDIPKAEAIIDQLAEKFDGVSGFAFALRTLRTGLLGLTMALALSNTVGFVVQVSPESTEISSLVGVMVSVALLPPLVVLGLLLGEGYWSAAFGAGLLVVTNLMCLNLAAMTTFMVQDLRPRQQEDVPKAKQLPFTAYSIWLLLLGALVGVVAQFHQVSFF